MIVAIVGGKGGVGKTTISLNLAFELDTVLVDADLGSPDIPRGTGPTLEEVLIGRVEPLAAIHSNEYLRVLPCGRTSASVDAADYGALPDVIDRLEREYGLVVIDCPAGLARDVGIVLSCADVCVLVTTPSRTALVDAARTRALALSLDVSLASVALNCVPSSTDLSALVERTEREFGGPVTVIPERAAVASAQSRRLPLRSTSPSDRAVDAFEHLAAIIERCRDNWTEYV